MSIFGRQNDSQSNSSPVFPSTTLIFSIVTSGLTLWILSRSLFELKRSKTFETGTNNSTQAIDSVPRHTLCFTNKTESSERTLIKRPVAVYSFNIPEVMSIFITNEPLMTLQKMGGLPCLMQKDSAFNVCCAFWPTMPKTYLKGPNFNYEYSLVKQKDTSFQPNHLLYGKQDFIMELIKLEIESDNRKSTLIDLTYITREVITDLYPEIHIKITVLGDNGDVIQFYSADWFI